MQIKQQDVDFDATDAIPFVEKFFAASTMEGELQSEVMVDRVRNLMGVMPSSMFFAYDDSEFCGLIFGIQSEDPFTGRPVAMKMHWTWKRGRVDVATGLLTAFEGWAKDQGCDSVIAATFSDFGTPSQDEMSTLGYLPHEIAYRKDF